MQDCYGGREGERQGGLEGRGRVRVRRERERRTQVEEVEKGD